MREAYRNVLLLALAQAVLMTGTSLLITSSALIGRNLADNPALATIPLGLQFLAMTLATIPSSLFMGRYGRRAGFLLGIGLGLLGTALATLAIFTSNFVLFCVAAALIGVFNGSGQFYRFAAADVATADWRPRAISLVLAGGIAAAFVGPNLAAWTRLLYGPEFAASFMILGGVYLLGVIVLSLLRIPAPPRQPGRDSGRPLAHIATRPVYLIAVGTAAVGYGVMNLLMVATPLSMDAHHHSFEDAAFVIQWHVLAMFLPSFFTGDLIRRLGLLRIISAGVVLMMLCVAVNWSGNGVWHYWAALALLGLGWNFMFIGGTTLLTETYREQEKPKSQALNDFIVFAIVTCTALGAGALLSTLGWQVMNLLVIPPLLLVLTGLVWLQLGRLRDAPSSPQGRAL